MRDIKTEPSEETIIYGALSNPIKVTDEVLENTEANPDKLIDIILQRGYIIIEPTGVLGRLSRDLLLLYEELRFSGGMMRCAFIRYAEETGGSDTLIRQIKKEKSMTLW